MVEDRKGKRPERQSSIRKTKTAATPMALLDRLLSDDPHLSGPAHEEATSASLPESLCSQFFDAYMNQKLRRDWRYSLVELISRFPEELVKREFAARFQIDSGIIHDAVMEGDESFLDMTVDGLVPGYQDSILFKQLVDEYLASAG